MQKILFTSMVVALLVAVAPVARAETIQIQYQVDSGTIVTCSAALPGPVGCANNPGPPLDITMLGADSNSPGGGSPASAVLTAADVDLVDTTGGPLTFDIVISANNFNTPAGGGLTLTSHIGGTVISGNSFSSLSFQSCVDNTNAIQDVSSLGVACPSGNFASGLSAPSISAPGVFDDTKIAAMPALSSPYSLNERYFFTLSSGEELNFSASTVVVSATPEPATIPLLGAGLVALGVLGRKRLFANK